MKLTITVYVIQIGLTVFVAAYAVRHDWAIGWQFGMGMVAGVLAKAMSAECWERKS